MNLMITRPKKVIVYYYMGKTPLFFVVKIRPGKHSPFSKSRLHRGPIRW